jgi:Threonine dehydrogenase and related Zn-dependent dehydrogenases
MNKTMMALRAFAPYDYRLVEVDVPQVSGKEILVKVKACGICAGDIKAFHGGIRIWGTSPLTRYIEAPVTGGHEFFGEVVKVGEEVEGYELGDLITAEQIVPCNACDFCRDGHYWMCQESAVYGFKAHAQGGFAEYIKLHSNSILHKIPKSFTAEQAVMIEPYACGMHAAERAGIRHSDVVVVGGLGAIGLAIANVVKLSLPKTIIGIDLRPRRLQLGKEYGCDIVLNPKDCDVVSEIKKITAGKGCDVYIESSGSEAGVRQGLDAIRNLGRYVQFGVFADEVKADWNIIGDSKEIQILGSHLSALCYDAVIGGIGSGLLRTEGLISHTFKLSDWAKAFETAEKDPAAMKVALRP